MRDVRIFSAPSLSEVIKHLMIYRLNGTLTIRRAKGFYHEDVTILIEYGRPTHIYRGRVEEALNELLLRQLNALGEIHFTFFQTVAPHLRIPGALQSSNQNRASQPPQSPVTRPLPAMPLVTTPLPAISRNSSTNEMLKQEKSGNGSVKNPPGGVERAIPNHTANAKGYRIESIPRYDRTIFLLINGRRTVSELTQLTKRTIEEVYNSLYRLQDQLLITV